MRTGSFPADRTRARAAHGLLVLGGVAYALAGCGGGAKTEPEKVEVYVPSGYVAGQPTPLVVYLHGYDGSLGVVQSDATYLRLRDAAESRTVLLALPIGAVYWAGAGCCGIGFDHVAFLKSVVAQASADFAVDSKRIYFFGWSNGAFMAHRFACEASDIAAAIVALAGDVWKDPASCQPSGPVAVLQVHGTEDGNVPYAGTDTPPCAGCLAFPSAMQSVATWAARNGCDVALLDSGDRLDLDEAVSGAETRVDRHACAQGAAELWSMVGSGHAPDFAQPSATERFFDWLLAHPKP